MVKGKPLHVSLRLLRTLKSAREGSSMPTAFLQLMKVKRAASARGRYDGDDSVSMIVPMLVPVFVHPEHGHELRIDG
jgi:type IV secretory pathway protease TraF